MVTKIFDLLTKNKIIVVLFILVSFFSAVYSLLPNTKNIQNINNSPGSVVIDGNIIGNVTTNVFTQSTPKLEYKELSSIKEADGLYHTTYGLMVSSLSEEDLKKIEIADSNFFIRCDDLPKAHFGIWAGFSEPGWAVNHSCVSTDPVTDDGQLFILKFKQTNI